MPFYLYKDKAGNVIGYNQTSGPVGSGAVPVSYKQFVAAGGVVQSGAHVPTESELMQQEITSLELSDIEQGQAMTELELMVLGGMAHV